MKHTRIAAGLLAAVMVFTALPANLTYAAAPGKEDAAKTQTAALPDPVLYLKFNGDLTDSSGKNHQVTVGAGSAAYETGKRQAGDATNSRALTMDGNTYLNLGKEADLSPGNLTLSFWMKAPETMGGERLITWNKNEYWTDGWYLTSENDNTPLALSAGPAKANGQPYKIVVESTVDRTDPADAANKRAQFFPGNEWTHVIVTYNSETKKAAVYRNGIPQNTRVAYAVSGESTGVIGNIADLVKEIGANGAKYKHAARLQGALDDYRLYDAELTFEQAVALYKDSGGELMETAVAAADLGRLDGQIPASAAGNITLPTKGVCSSAIRWTSSHGDIISTAGKVTSP